jgi:hypothetical protein
VVKLGIRTLDFWVDNVSSDYLYPFMNDVMAELMRYYQSFKLQQVQYHATRILIQVALCSDATPFTCLNLGLDKHFYSISHCYFLFSITPVDDYVIHYVF